MDEQDEKQQDETVDRDLMSDVVDSLKAQIRQRDDDMQRLRDVIADRDKTIRMLLDGEEQERTVKTESDRLAEFRKKCRF